MRLNYTDQQLQNGFSTPGNQANQSLEQLQDQVEEEKEIDENEEPSFNTSHLRIKTQ